MACWPHHLTSSVGGGREDQILPPPRSICSCYRKTGSWTLSTVLGEHSSRPAIPHSKPLNTWGSPVWLLQLATPSLLLQQTGHTPSLGGPCLPSTWLGGLDWLPSPCPSPRGTVRGSLLGHLLGQSDLVASGGGQRRRQGSAWKQVWGRSRVRWGLWLGLQAGGREAPGGGGELEKGQRQFPLSQPQGASEAGRWPPALITVT